MDIKKCNIIEIEPPTTKFTVGLKIKNKDDEWEILEVDSYKIRIKVLSTGPDKKGSIGSYLDVGKEYNLYRHIHNIFDEIWEIPSKEMKRNTSQVLLYWFNGDDEPMIDLDF